MRRFTIAILLLGLAASVASAGLFKNSVDLADLAEIPQESVEALADTEFGVFVAEVRLAGARAAERRAAGALKAAKRTLEIEALDLKAAKAEAKAAKANEDSARQSAAIALLDTTEHDRKVGEAFLAWKKQETEARESEVRAAKFGLDLAEARRDLARAKALLLAEAPSAMKYDVAELEQSVRKREKELTSASRDAEQKAAKLDSLRVGWESIAKERHLVPSVEE